ncbi:unnamed protein product, partial [Choristocarpus tenellus]
LIRRFLRTSGLPLDHIFATAVIVYRREHLGPAFRLWKRFIKTDILRLTSRAVASLVIQRAWHSPHGPSRTSDKGFSKDPTTDDAEAQGIQQELNELAGQQRVVYKLTTGQGNDSQQLKEEPVSHIQFRIEAVVALQSLWRGTMCRVQVGQRLHGRLRKALIELGGGKGRIHR